MSRRNVTEVGGWETVDPRRRILPLICFVAIVAGLLVWATKAFGQEFDKTHEEIAIPDIEVPFEGGKPLAKARADIEARGLEVDTIESPNELVPPGVVSAQNPAAGAKLPEGSLVILVVSQGTAQFTVPDVTGQQWQDAIDVISLSSLTPVPRAEYSETVRVGEVIATKPSPGTRLPLGANVEVSLSAGKSPRVVPNVVNKPVAQAMNEIGLGGLGIGTIHTVYDDRPAGVVVSTDPPAGSFMNRDAPVTVTITGGRPTIEVPSVEGLREADAVDKIVSAGLKVRVLPWAVTYGAPETGRVVRQGTPPLAKVDPDQVVELLVGTAPPPPTTQPPPTLPPTTQPPPTTSVVIEIPGTSIVQVSGATG